MKPIHIHCFQHVPFETPAAITNWIVAHGFSLTTTHLYLNEPVPPLNGIDWLLVMGGPMNIYEEDQYNWLAAEKQFIKSAIAGGKVVIGICLGAQLIADALGAKVYKNEDKEIGWWQVELTEDALQNEWGNIFPEVFTVYQWHGDTFDIPDGCIHIIESAVCQNQAFTKNNLVYAFQFHLEMTTESIVALIENCGNELEPPTHYIQTAEQMIVGTSNLEKSQKMLYQFLDAALEKYSRI